MHVVPPAIRIVVVLAGVMVGPSLPGFTMAPCEDSLLSYRLIRQPKPNLQDSPKIYGTCMHLYNCILVVLLISWLNLACLSLEL
jgi:hypothetical protein